MFEVLEHHLGDMANRFQKHAHLKKDLKEGQTGFMEIRNNRMREIGCLILEMEWDARAIQRYKVSRSYYRTIRKARSLGTKLLCLDTASINIAWDIIAKCHMEWKIGTQKHRDG